MIYTITTGSAHVAHSEANPTRTSVGRRVTCSTAITIRSETKTYNKIVKTARQITHHPSVQ